MAPVANDVALRKRTQIAKANRTMFIWIAVASALVGTAVVVSIFFAQKLIYTEDVLGAKLNTVNTLDANLTVIETLENEIKALDANSALGSAKANENDQAVQVILDALPSEANSLALGASLQQRLLTGIEGNFTLETLQIDQVAGVEILSEEGDSVDASSEGDGETVANQITFSFSAIGDETSLKQVLQNLERSLRTIEITSLTLEMSSSGSIQMRVQGRAFYEPAKSIELRDEEVPLR